MSNLLIPEIETFLADNPDIEEFEVVAMAISGRYFGKRYPIEFLSEFAEQGLVFPRSMFTLSSVGSLLPGTYFGIEDGDPDAAFHLVPGRLSRINWGNKPRAQVLASSLTDEAFFEPRYVLEKILESYQKRGWHPTVAFELEFYLFDGERDDLGLVQTVINPKTGQPDSANVLSSERISDFEAVIEDILQACQLQGIATGAISAELGPGQFEINFNHHEDVLRAADESGLFQHCVREVAKQHGMTGSFMAKPLLDEAGNGLHMHISICDEEGNNIFAAGDQPTPLLHHAIGGLLEAMPECMSMWAPLVNSYRRFKGGTSCAPVSQSWGMENRTVAFRIPLAKANAWRVENRVPGADANPYLAMAATLAAMLHGIDQQINPGEPSQQALDVIDDNVPMSVTSAVERSRKGGILGQYLGEEFMQFYCLQREAEAEAFSFYLSNREYDWYL